MLKGQKLAFGPRRSELKSRERILPVKEPRCAGRACDSRSDCERYQRAVFEAVTPNAPKGKVLMMNMADSDGVCRRKV